MYARALRRKEVNLSTKVIRYEMIEHQTRYASISRKQDQTASIGRLFYRFSTQYPLLKYRSLIMKHPVYVIAVRFR